MQNQINNGHPNKRHHNMKEFTGVSQKTNGGLYLAYKEQRISLVDILTMSWMRQRD